jgi:hypothetical protein
VADSPDTSNWIQELPQISSQISGFWTACKNEIRRDPKIEDVLVYTEGIENASGVASMAIWWQLFNTTSWLELTRKMGDADLTGKFSEAIQLILPRANRQYVYQKCAVITRLFPFIQNHVICDRNNRITLDLFLIGMLEGRFTLTGAIKIATAMKGVSKRNIAWQIFQLYRGDDIISPIETISPDGDVMLADEPPSNYVTVGQYGDNTYKIVGIVDKTVLDKLKEIEGITWDK